MSRRQLQEARDLCSRQLQDRSKAEAPTLGDIAVVTQHAEGAFDSDESVDPSTSSPLDFEIKVVGSKTPSAATESVPTAAARTPLRRQSPAFVPTAPTMAGTALMVQYQ